MNSIDTAIFWVDNAYISAFANFGLTTVELMQRIMAVRIFNQNVSSNASITPQAQLISEFFLAGFASASPKRDFPECLSILASLLKT